MAPLKTKVYEVRAQRRGGWWVIRVPEVRGVHSQARRLDQVEDMAKDALALALDVSEDSFDVNVIPEVAEDMRQAMARVDDLRKQLESTEHELRRSVERITLLLRKENLTLRDVGQLVGLSYQRVAQLVDAAQRGGRLPGTPGATSRSRERTERPVAAATSKAGRTTQRLTRTAKSSQVLPPMIAPPS